MKGLVGKLVLLAGSVLLTLVAAELALRIVGYEYRPMQIATGVDRDARMYHLFGDENFVYDPLLIWRPKPGFGVFNSDGFRGPEVGARNGKLRIATVGDSNTLGWSGPDGANWPADLADLLDEGGVETEVINAGVWGYSSHQGVPRTREVLELAPHIVLISFGSNDAHLVSRTDAEFSGVALESRRATMAIRKLRVAQLLTAVLDGLDSAATEPRPRVNQDDYRRNLEVMVAEVRATGAVPVLLTRPFYGPVLDATKWKAFGPDYNLATAQVADEQGVLIVDVYSFFKEMDDLFADESHFTDEGHHRAAAIILEHLRPLVAAR